MKAIRNILRLFRNKFKFFAVLAVLLLFFLFVHFTNREVEHHESFSHFRRYHWDLSHIGVKNYPEAKVYERWDWNNYELISYEKTRKGPGEQGEGVTLTDPADIRLDAKLEPEEGLHVVISDKISVNRSVKDSRPKM